MFTISVLIAGIAVIIGANLFRREENELLLLSRIVVLSILVWVITTFDTWSQTLDWFLPASWYTYLYMFLWLTLAFIALLIVWNVIGIRNKRLELEGEIVYLQRLSEARDNWTPRRHLKK